MLLRQRVRFCGPAFVAAIASAQLAHASDDIEFNRDIRPILSENCFRCHGPSSASREAELRLDQRESAVDNGAITPGKPDESELVRRISADDPEEVMPPPSTKKSLTAGQKDLLRRWIAAGAEYQPHWAFISFPAEVPVPQPADPQHWIHNEIDAFVLARLQSVELRPDCGATACNQPRRPRANGGCGA